ncbi:hypothetical protein AKJ44_02095 [candidate division MSBL1 archaeon SCGC-AAA261F17]|uniref:Uncharacterized protein n=1 Tax=candidate division MSBL1 archaeon SCGC-AAA261F17 TaxID=1698274 RepID=A0A133V5W9_9EURY|nr:hypothetical protein AKJ44_02095 [candidate division MSBL1 archaeon SCGC-AAA261F17]
MDEQAAEIASVNLMLKGMQKNERFPDIFGYRVIPAFGSCSVCYIFYWVILGFFVPSLLFRKLSGKSAFCLDLLLDRNLYM